MIFFGNGLRTPLFFNREGVICAAFHGGVIDENHTLLTNHSAYAGDNASTGHYVVIYLEGGELGELQKR